ncbi:MAG: HU family DNA-binding protein [Planctomycetota bacterium]|jgi:DNA-binding protein HU-beta
MNKEELVGAVLGSKAGLASKAAAERAVNAVLDGIRKGLQKDKRVQLIGFGTFSVKKRGPRKVRNPHTGEMMNVKARRVAHFKPGKALNDAV